jgi:Domain of unknown function (DUF4034)
MRSNISFCLLLAVVAGCSKQPAGTNPQLPKQSSRVAPSPAALGRPAELTIVETTEDKERGEIRAKSLALLTAQRYDELDALASKYRSSKECYADGIWKLKEVYEGLVPDDKESDSQWERRLAAIREWIKAKPESITARVSLADVLISYAWKARGDGYANTVSQNGWKLFHERLKQSVQVMNDSKNFKESCPRWWSNMLRASLGLGVERQTYEAVFNEAVKAEPANAGYYVQMAHYLLPRWHGKPNDIAVFLKNAADKIGGDDGDVLYAQVAWYLQGIEGNIFDERNNLSWERADHGFQVLEKRFPNSPLVQNGRAYIAVIGCPKTLLPRRLVAGLNGNIDPKTWTSKQNFRRLTDDLFRS